MAAHKRCSKQNSFFFFLRAHPKTHRCEQSLNPLATLLRWIKWAKILKYEPYFLDIQLSLISELETYTKTNTYALFPYHILKMLVILLLLWL